LANKYEDSVNLHGAETYHGGRPPAYSLFGRPLGKLDLLGVISMLAKQKLNVAVTAAAAAFSLSPF